jgi:hypothetical protein
MIRPTLLTVLLSIIAVACSENESGPYYKVVDTSGV